jgi:hypothetical protein
VESLQSTLRQQYSNSNLTKLNNSNSTVDSTVSCKEVFSNLTDVIPDDDYMPFYVSQFKRLGAKRFVELANKARAGGKNPMRLFTWMLKNNELVK